MLNLMGAALYAFLFRWVRGGGIETGESTIGRVTWSTLAILWVFTISSNPAIWWCLPLLFLASVVGWFNAAGMGFNVRPTDPWWSSDKAICWAIMTARGLLFGLAFLPMVWLGVPEAIYLLPASMLMGTAYLIGWLIPSRIPNLQQGMPLGELIYGAVLGYSVTLVFS